MAGRGPPRALWIGLFLASLIAVGAIVWVKIAVGPQPIDALGCRRDHLIPAHTVVLVDQSDPFTRDQQRWVDKTLHDTAEDLPRYALTTVLGLKANSEDLAEVYRGCSPGSPKQANFLIASLRLVEFNWQERFFAPMQRATQTLLEERTQPASPILEAIGLISERSDFTSEVPVRRIAIISDMQQNSPLYSFMRSPATWAAFSSSHTTDDLPDLTGVTLAIHIVPRRSYATSIRQVRAFWTAYANATHAEIEFY